MEQLTMFDTLWERYKIMKPIRLIELFAGYGSQHLALKYIGADFESWRIAEWAVKSIQAYKDLHCPDDHNDYAADLTPDEIANFLFKKGISADYNKPMTLEQIKRLGADKTREIYNNIIATKNLVSVCNIKGKDLQIVDKDKYEYVCCYSFPCQDLSIAGLNRGMKKGSGTRSGLLWEVERILHELKELDQLPQVLLMENVPLVHGEQNWADFNAWKKSLQELGYCSFWKDLMATDYGVPQTRDRCFMVSILGDYNFEFPKPFPLIRKLKDLLDKQVDEKYYLSDKMIAGMQHTSFHQYQLKNRLQDPDKPIDTLTTRTGEGVPHCIAIKNNTKQGYLLAEEGDGVDIGGRMEYHRGTVQKGKCQTITTFGGENVGVVVKDDTVLKRELCNKLIADGEVEEGDIVKHSYTQQIFDGKKKCVERGDGTMITLTTRGDTLGVVVRDPQVVGGVGEKKSNGGTQYYLQDRIYDGDKAVSIATAFNPFYKVDENEDIQTKDFKAAGLRIRKLTPRECFRLMGVVDEDYAKIEKHQTGASLYHLAGDSIVVDVLEAIFKELIYDYGNI